MKRVLGLDIGTNSVGWAVLDVDGNRKEVVDLGQYIFTMGRDDSKQITKAEERRRFRAARRGYMRYRLSRDGTERGRTPGLIPLLIEKGMMPPHSVLAIDGKNKKYILDDKALWLNSAFKGLGANTQGKFVQSKFLYALRAKAPTDQISLQELGRLILWLNRRRGWCKTKGEADEGREGSQEANEKKKAIAAMSRLGERVHQVPGRTLGQYFNELVLQAEESEWNLVDDEVKSIRRRFVHRSLYIEEFNAIWNKQAEFHPELRDDELLTTIRDRILFYQRPLRSQKHLVRECPIFPPKKCAPRSSLTYQHFRILQQLVNVRLPGNELLSPDQIILLFDILNTSEKMGRNKLKEVLGLNKKLKFFEFPKKEGSKKEQDELIGNTTIARIIEATDEAFVYSLDDATLEKIIHSLHFTKEGKQKKLEEYLLSECKVPKEHAEALSKVELEPGYGRFSRKALLLFIPRLFMGNSVTEARMALSSAGIMNERSLPKRQKLSREDSLHRDMLALLPNPVVRRSLGSVIRLGNDLIRRFGPFDEAHIELARPVAMSAEQREKYEESINNRRVRRDKIKAELASLDVKITEKNILKYELLEECNYKCPYTEEPLNLGKVFKTGEADIEHIHPRSTSSARNRRINLTLAGPRVNRELKQNMNPYEYFRTQPADEWDKFVRRIESSKNFSQAKKRWFLRRDTPSGNAPGQEADTGTIARLAGSILNQLDSLKKPVWTIRGGYTAKLRGEWGLNSLLNPEGKNIKYRGDHRHHAIDAVVIAAAEPWMVEKVASSEPSDDDADIPRKYDIPPPAGLRQRVNELKDRALTSFQSQTRLVSKSTNRFTSRDSNGKKEKVKSAKKSFSVHQPLHDSNYFGVRPNDEGGHTIVTRKSLRSMVSGPSKTLDTIRRDVKSIRDETIREQLGNLVNMVAEDGGLPKVKALLGAENGVDLKWQDEFGNSKRMIVKRVLLERGTLDSELRTHVKVRRHMDTTKERYDFADSNNNYCVAVYGPMKNGKNDYHVVPFHEAVRNKLRNDGSGENMFPPSKNGIPLRYILKINDVIACYDNDPDEINLEDRKDLFERLFKVRNIPLSNQIVIDRHFASQPKERNIDHRYIRIPSLKAVKVILSPSGEPLEIFK